VELILRPLREEDMISQLESVVAHDNPEDHREQRKQNDRKDHLPRAAQTSLMKSNKHEEADQHQNPNHNNPPKVSC